MALRAILFDKDGTFVDFQATWSPATHAVMRRMAAGDADKFAALAAHNHYDPETGKLAPTSPLVAGSSADYGQAWAAILGVAPSTAFLSHMDTLFAEEALAHLAPIGEPARLFEGLKRDGYALGIVTNDSEIGARSQCDRLGLTPWLDAIIGYDSGHGRKPEAGQIRAFGRRHGYRPSEMALVGDTLHDLHAARAAGVTAIAVLTGFADATVLAPHADHVLPDLMALPALLASKRAMLRHEVGQHTVTVGYPADGRGEG